MPPKGKSKAQFVKGQFIGQFSNLNKGLTDAERKLDQKRAEIEAANEQLNLLKKQKEQIKEQQLKLELDNEKLLVEQEKVKTENREISKSVHKNQRKLHRKTLILKSLSERTNSVTKDIALTEKLHESKIDVSISKRVSTKRKQNPTTSMLSQKAKTVRRIETIKACSAIHGGSPENFEPVIDGMLQTLTSKCNKKHLSKKIRDSSKGLSDTLSKQVLNDWSCDYQNSDENLLRSLNTYYSHNVMGKIKYLSILKANKGPVHSECKLPNYVPYTTLSNKIQQIDIGNVIPVHPSLTDGSPNSEIDGMYRNVDQFALRLAKFYLTVNIGRKDKLKQFNHFKKKDNNSYLFNIALGGDGAPISGCVFLISFINVGDRIASSSENFLIFGANVDETSSLVRNFIKKLLGDIKYLENNIFDIITSEGVKKVEFTLSELPNDMKMLAFLAGELSNSARYFSTFGDVHTGDSNDLNKKFDPSSKSSWKPYDYTKRVEDAKKVTLRKQQLSASKISVTGQRTQLTQYIGTTLKSRQEEIPLVEQYINVAKSEPLHLKNNTTKELFMKIFKIVISYSKVKSFNSFSNIPSDNVFSKFTTHIRYKMGCTFLAKKIATWFNENKGKVETEFSFRFRGKESQAYIKHFPELIKMVLDSVKSEEIIMKLYQVFYSSIHHRKLISLSVRITNFNADLLEEMKKESHLLFKASCMFSQRVSPSMWTLCNALPFHAEKTLQQYQLGIGVNTMEGREQKHQQIQKYSHNTTFQNRWSLIYRHEFIQLIYLRENGYDTVNYRKRSNSYVPVPVLSECIACGLKLSDKLCSMCDSVQMKKIYDMMS